MNTLELQKRLKALGFYAGPLDGVMSDDLESAIIRFKVSVGLKARPYVGPITVAFLRSTQVLPWLQEINKVLGLHEKRDNKALSSWLKSDGPTVGNPASIAWCGDATETAMYRALPDEPKIKNPYWARNWAKFGKECFPAYGSVAVFKRGSGGHVGFLVGVSKAGELLRIRGGNQSNMINDTWISKNRLLNLRWPSTYPDRRQRPAPVLNSTGGYVSRNEA